VAQSWAELLPKLEAVDIQDSQASTMQESKNAGPLGERITAAAKPNGAKFQGVRPQDKESESLVVLI
jgi:hypothetical protein